LNIKVSPLCLAFPQNNKQTPDEHFNPATAGLKCSSGQALRAASTERISIDTPDFGDATH
jgi:hypothetical protein